MASPTIARNASGSNGFSTKWKAPARRAATAIGISPCPVIMTTTCPPPISCKRPSRSMPLMPGRRTSSRTQAGSRALADCRNSSAEAKPVTATPMVDNSTATESRSCASSSTIKTRGSATMAAWSIDTQLNGKAGTPTWEVLPVQLTGVGFNDLAGERQAQPHAVWFAGLKGLKQPIGDIGRHARSAVIDFDQHTIPALLDPHPHQTMLGGIGPCRLDGVAHQVQQQLFELDRIAAHTRQIGRATHLDAHAAAILAPEHARNLAGHSFDIDLAELHATAGNIIPDPFQGFPYPPRLGFGLGQGVGGIGVPAALRLEQDPPRGVEIVGGGCQG